MLEVSILRSQSSYLLLSLFIPLSFCFSEGLFISLGYGWNALTCSLCLEPFLGELLFHWLFLTKWINFFGFVSNYHWNWYWLVCLAYKSNSEGVKQSTNANCRESRLNFSRSGGIIYKVFLLVLTFVIYEKKCKLAFDFTYWFSSCLLMIPFREKQMME